jgi:hypothetical protein
LSPSQKQIKTARLSLRVTPTGTITKSSPTDFVLAPGAPAAFLFSTLDGTISGWNPNVGIAAFGALGSSTHAVIVVKTADGSSYTGLTSAIIKGNRFLYAANFNKGTVDVYNNAFQKVTLLPNRDGDRDGENNRSFTDDHLPPDFVPFNVQAIGNDIVVTFDHASRLSERDSRELVVLAVGGTYLQVLSASARIDTQRVQVKYAQATYDRANTQLSAGTNTRVDLTRSLVQLQSEQERLLALEGDYQQQKIAFARLIGLPQDAEVIFIEQLGSSGLQPVEEADALRAALEHRWDLQSVEVQMCAAEQTVSAARSERLPSLSFNGYYGAMGPRPTESHGVFVASGTLSIPVFDGGKNSADVQQDRATLRQRQAEYEDQKAKVDQDVRNAVIQLRTALGQVNSQSRTDSMRETLTQVNDRFDAGVTNTVEVVQAQQQEAAAENDYSSGLYALNLARLTLARAIGDAEAELSSLFPGEKH